MSARAATLTARFAAANQATIDLIADASHDDVRRICEGEGWSVAAVGAHVATSQVILIDRVRRIVEDEELPQFAAADIHAGNARTAQANADLTSDEVVALLRDHGARTAEYLRGLRDDDLDRARHIPAMGETPATAEQIIERVVIGHSEMHLQSLRQSLATPETVPE